MDTSEATLRQELIFRDLNVDIKVTSVKQPQFSCPFKSASQKIFGLGYHLLIFVYEKSDDEVSKTGRLNTQHTVFVEKMCTADSQTTKGLRNILEPEKSNFQNSKGMEAITGSANFEISEWMLLQQENIQRTRRASGVSEMESNST